MRLALIALLLASCTAGAPSPSPTPSGGAAATPSAAQVGWRRVADIPTPRSEVASAVFRGVVYVVGGLGGGTAVEMYGGDRWSQAAKYPLAVDHAMAAGVETEGTPGVYVFGGNVNATALARSFRFTPDQGWREIAAMPAPRAQGAAVAIGAKIYVVGGAQSDRLVSPTYVYDTTADRWSTVAAIPTPRDHLAAAALGGRVCAIGGRRLSLLQNLATFECYDPATDAWRAMPDAPTARGGLGATVISGRIYVAGGEQPSGTFKEVDVFDGASGSWSRGPNLPTPRHGLAVQAVANTLYVLTGGPTPGGSQTPVCEALEIK